MPNFCPNGTPLTYPMTRPLTAVVRPLETFGGLPAMLVEHEKAAILHIRLGTPDTKVLESVIDLLFWDHPPLLRQWIDGWNFHHISLDQFAADWPTLVGHIPRTLATPLAVPRILRAQLN